MRLAAQPLLWLPLLAVFVFDLPNLRKHLMLLAYVCRTSNVDRYRSACSLDSIVHELVSWSLAALMTELVAQESFEVDRALQYADHERNIYRLVRCRQNLIKV